MFKLRWLALCIPLLLGADATGREAFHLERYPLAGTWQAEGARYYVTHWGESPYVVRAADGRVWRLQPSEEAPSRLEASLLDGTPAGSLTLDGADAWHPAGESSPIRAATRVRVRSEHFVVRNGDDAELHGTILWPKDSPPRAMILYLNGEGPNPRTDLLPHALALLEDGFGAIVFDQRHAGDSTGKPNKGTYRERSLRAAADATAVSRMITGGARFKNLPVGTLGWSQGGWIGAIVARENADLDFHVCVAGNAAPGSRQWRHSMRSRLIRGGVEPGDLAKADRYFDVFFDVMRGHETWDRYVAALTVARAEAWWPVMKRRNVAEWESEEEAHDYWSKEKLFVPANDFEALRIPALGVFFEFDGSTTPDSPGIFAAALAASEAPGFAVVQLPGLQHGSWVVEGYADMAARFSTRSPMVNEVISDWISRTIDEASLADVYPGR